jgi:putative lipoprotein
MLLVLAAAATPAAAGPVTLTGEITYRERMALPPNAQLRVRLIDTTRPGAPPAVEAAGAIASHGRVPLTFTLNFDDGVIDPEHDYALLVEISAAGELWFTNAEPYPIEPLTASVPGPILLNFAGRANEPTAEPVEPAPPVILDTVWRAEDLGGTPVAATADTSLSIASDMRAGGRGGCNSYFAQVRLQGESLRFSAIAATRMACAATETADLEAGFFAALEATRFWQVHDGKLHLLDADGRELVRFAQSAR